MYATWNMTVRASLAAWLVVVCLAPPASAQTRATRLAASRAGAVIDGPAPPVPPATITRDGSGQATVRAIRLTEPLTVDGALDEPVYLAAPPFGGLIQVVPRAGAPASETSDVWVMFDAEHVYVAARLWDSAPPEKWVANEMRRDTNQLRNNDTFGVMFDTFYDRRSAFMFYTNPLGALADYSIVDEGQPNTDWNPVWEVRTGRFAGGWSVEMAIPFKTLRYTSGSDQTWGFQLRRSVRRKNEWSYLTAVPTNLAGPQAFNRVSAGGTLVGLDLPPARRNVEVKPYAISKMTTDRVRAPALDRAVDGSVGGDVKYGVTAGLTADLTVNTDFAQVEIDEQQVNLTRFSLFFPEKRDFFLEGRGLFDFARGGATSGGGPQHGTPSDTPYLFYSRRIGLTNGHITPITVGGRLTGKVGRYGVGVMNIQGGDEPVAGTAATNFTVMRVKRDILKRSTIGAMFTNRAVALSGPGASQAFGVDAAFSLTQAVNATAYYARTSSPGRRGDAQSYQAKIDFNTDRYGAQAEYLKVGAAFNPEIGFLRRADFGRSFAALRFSPRPTSLPGVRKLTWQGNFEYVLNGAGQVESRRPSGRFNAEFENSDQFTVEASRSYELLVRPFEVGGGMVIPAGGYDFHDATVSYQLGQQRPVSGTVSLQRGGFYDGTLTALGYSTTRVTLTKQFSLEPAVSLNWIDLPSGRFVTRVLRSRVDYAFSPRMFASALLQYSSADRTFNSNLRFRWEYRPGSELFVVWTDERDTAFAGRPAALRNRAFVVKATRLLRF